jgi:hypothetical protein
MRTTPEHTYELRILNLVGVEVEVMRRSVEFAGSLELDISTVDPGMYVLSLKDGSGSDLRAVFLKK